MDIIEENFKLYKARKLNKDNDYALWEPRIGNFVPTNCIPYTDEELKLYVKHKPLISKAKYDALLASAEPGSQVAIPNVSLLKKAFINKLHPDNLDSREFWKAAVDNFPYYSIAGGNAGCKSPEECNEINLKMAMSIGILPYYEQALIHFPTPKVLEIGPGYGNICYWTQDNFPTAEYHAIDVHPLFDWPTLYQTDGFNIPESVPNNLNIVYSNNVFQHLSKSQRTSYYKQIFEVLEEGGVFYFGMFTLTDNNKDWPVWGMKDYKGRYYAGFLKQFTEVDHIDETKAELEEIGFEFKNISWHESHSNHLTFQAVKPNNS